MGSCEANGCKKRPNFNTRGYRKGRFCFEHKEEGMMDVIHPTCENCDKRPHFNTRGNSKGRFCFEHKEQGMVDVISPMCEKCDKRPNFNTRGTSKGRFCSEHKEEGMIDVIHRTCEKCDVQPTFNQRGQAKGRFCFEHKEEGMVDVKNQTCENCDRQPNFNTRGYRKGRFCFEHKEEGMVDVKNPTCEKCEKQPSFNTSGNKKGRYCSEHKEQGMVDVISPTCENCDKRPSFNTRGSLKGRFCSEHKEEGMVNVKDLVCEKCDKYPIFNKRGLTRGRFCNDHKEPDMVDVKNPTCEQCNKRPVYGFAGKKPTFCYLHRQLNTIKQPTKRCLEAKCTEFAIYGTQTHEHCEQHKLPNETNLVERQCKSCGLLGFLDKNEHCETCDPKAFRRIRLAKQTAVVDYLIANGIPITLDMVDKTVDNGSCGLERPDIRIDCGSHILIIEVDEHQHSGRPCECEQTRMVNISQSNGMPTVFVRYNPDKYKVPKGRSMEGTTKRLAHLLEWVRYHITSYPTAFLSVRYLFFDFYQKDDEKLQIVTPFDSDMDISNRLETLCI